MKSLVDFLWQVVALLYIILYCVLKHICKSDHLQWVIMHKMDLSLWIKLISWEKWEATPELMKITYRAKMSEVRLGGVEGG